MSDRKVSITVRVWQPEPIAIVASVEFDLDNRVKTDGPLFPREMMLATVVCSLCSQFNRGNMNLLEKLFKNGE